MYSNANNDPTCSRKRKNGPSELNSRTLSGPKLTHDFRDQKELAAVIDTNAKRSKNDKSISSKLISSNFTLDYLSNFSSKMQDYYSKICQKRETFLIKKNILSNLQYNLSKLFSACRLRIVGSSLTGFATDSSDIDICMYFLSQGTSQFPDNYQSSSYLYQVCNYLRRYGCYRRVQYIGASVPIVRFTVATATGRHVEVDLNVNNVVGVRNTHLLQCYARADQRLRVLMVCVKQWAKSHDINDALHRSLSSYTLELMLINFLQCGVSPPVLPVLQQMYPSKFCARSDVSELPCDDDTITHRSHNTQSVAELFLAFFHYYGYTYRFEQDVASVRLGKRLQKHTCSLVNVPNNFISSWGFVCVEEPFTLNNTARSCKCYIQLSRIKEAFRTSWRAMDSRLDIQRVFGTHSHEMRHLLFN